MMQTPDHHNFIADDGSLTGVGKLHPGQFIHMRLQCIDLHKCAVQLKFSKKLLVFQFTVILENLLHCLKFISMNFCHMQITVRETQRVFVELTVLLDYYNYFRPTLLMNESSTPTQTYPPTIAKIMGVFMTDLTVCDLFFWAGIPVWLVRPFEVLSSICIRVLAPVQTLEASTPLSPATYPSHPTIYCGNGDHIDKY
jgi:hypothetical protein